MTGRLRVIIADDHYLMREGIRRALSDEGRFEVVAAVGTAEELERVTDREIPDVIVTDIRMPPTHTTEGIDAALNIRAKHPQVGVVVLSQYNDPTYAMALLRDGTRGMAYLLKERIGDPRTVSEAAIAVAAGGSRIDPDVVSLLVRAGHDSSPLSRLTEREHEVLELMAQGRTNAGIAEELFLSESSIEKYASSMFAKLGLNDEPHLHRRVAAVLAFLHDQGRAGTLDSRGPFTDS
jgi:DNA-binding NarL/FixJ family response regulator